MYPRFPFHGFNQLHRYKHKFHIYIFIKPLLPFNVFTCNLPVTHLHRIYRNIPIQFLIQLASTFPFLNSLNISAKPYKVYLSFLVLLTKPYTVMSCLRILLFQFLIPLILSSRLRRSTTCPSLLTYFKSAALPRVGPYGFSSSPPFRRFQPVLLSQPQPEALAAAPDAPQAGVDFSETNVQVEGVDEPDIIKTDGKRIFVLRANTLFVISVLNDGTAGSITGKLVLPNTPSELLIQDDRILVIAREFSRSIPVPLPRPIPLAGSALARSIAPFPQLTKIFTVIYQISVTRKTPVILSTLRLEGRYVNAREVDGTARIVLQTDLVPRFVFKIPRFGADSKALEEAEKFNKDLLRKSTIRSWLPTYTLTENTRCSGEARNSCRRTTSGLITSCEKVFVPSSSFSGFGLLSIVTLPLKGRLIPKNSASIASDAREVYATANSLYVTTTRYRFDFPFFAPIWGRDFRTTLHKFRLGPRGAAYVGSGDVAGSVLNQFSMHEFKGNFFVATTEGASWWTGRDTSKSRVTAFEVKGRRLVETSNVGNLGIGERIFAVRYIADKAYVVTFRQIDPLYIIDLSNPRRLRVTGELKIPGFSSYLHPIAPGKLLGVGREATNEGRVTGAKVSLFDVSDATKPKEVAAWKLSGGFSSAEFDHRAFLFWEPEKIAVLPVSVFSRNEKERFTGSVVLDVGRNTLTERGRIVHSQTSKITSFVPAIERNFVLGRVYLWSLSSRNLQVNAIKSLRFVSKVALDV